MVVSIGVNERDGRSIYNTQLLFDAHGTLIQRRREITPTYHERMIWGQGDGTGLLGRMQGARLGKPMLPTVPVDVTITHDGNGE
jgi:predicted amidohydrolase